MNYETEDITSAKIKNVEFVLGSREYGIKYLNGDKLHNSALIFIVNL
ncbi:MAG: hypothetical protein O8C62_06125 [Candidatus Methanoperedens sp.]|nr:hypothetical protein [Candidatus Methanoperedens sp.]